MQRLARWVYGQWAPSKPRRIPPWDAIDVLASIRAGGSGNCAQYAIVQVQSALSLGWQARYLSLGTDHPGNQHTSVEVWSNTFDKWVVLDTHFGLFVEDEARPGVPLSAREIHEALVGGRREGLLVRSFGGDEEAHPRPGVDFLPYFFHLAADQRNDHLSGAPLGWTRKETYLAWRDEHTDGRPALFSELTESSADFDPPMNQIEVMFLTPMPARRKPGLVLCAARTNMSAMASIKVTLGDEPPRHVPLRSEPGSSTADPAEDHALQEGAAPTRTLDKQFGQLLLWSWQLTPGSNRVSFQGVNTLGVEGPAAVFELEFEP